MIDATEEQRAAHSTVHAARKYDRRHGTSRAAGIPESIRVLDREYKRLQMAHYRRRDGIPCVQPLKEDGIIDPIAVEIAAHGTRVVELTQRERVLAVWLMQAWRVDPPEMIRRLHLPVSSVSYLRLAAAKLSETEFLEMMGS